MKDIMPEVMKQVNKLGPAATLFAVSKILKKMTKKKGAQKGGKINKKGGFYKEILSQAQELAPVALLVAGQRLLSKKSKKGGARNKK